MNDELKSLWKAKFPTWFWFKLPFNFQVEFVFLYKIRQLRDGMSFFDFKIDLDLYDPLEYAKFIVNPRFTVHWVLFNYTIFEFNFYKIKADIK